MDIQPGPHPVLATLHTEQRDTRLVTCYLQAKNLGSFQAVCKGLVEAFPDCFTEQELQETWAVELLNERISCDADLHRLWGRQRGARLHIRPASVAICTGSLQDVLPMLQKQQVVPESAAPVREPRQMEWRACVDVPDRKLQGRLLLKRHPLSGRGQLPELEADSPLTLELRVCLNHIEPLKHAWLLSKGQPDFVCTLSETLQDMKHQLYGDQGCTTVSHYVTANLQLGSNPLWVFLVPLPAAQTQQQSSSSQLLSSPPQMLGFILPVRDFDPSRDVCRKLGLYVDLDHTLVFADLSPGLKHLQQRCNSETGDPQARAQVHVACDAIKTMAQIAGRRFVSEQQRPDWWMRAFSQKKAELEYVRTALEKLYRENVYHAPPSGRGSMTVDAQWGGKVQCRILCRNFADGIKDFLMDPDIDLAINLDRLYLKLHKAHVLVGNLQPDSSAADLQQLIDADADIQRLVPEVPLSVSKIAYSAIMMPDGRYGGHFATVTMAGELISDVSIDDIAEYTVCWDPEHQQWHPLLVLLRPFCRELLDGACCSTTARQPPICKARVVTHASGGYAEAVCHLLDPHKQHLRKAHDDRENYFRLSCVPHDKQKDLGELMPRNPVVHVNKIILDDCPIWSHDYRTVWAEDDAAHVLHMPDYTPFVDHKHLHTTYRKLGHIHDMYCDQWRTFEFQLQQLNTASILDRDVCRQVYRPSTGPLILNANYDANKAASSPRAQSSEGSAGNAFDQAFAAAEQEEVTQRTAVQKSCKDREPSRPFSGQAPAPRAAWEDQSIRQSGAASGLHALELTSAAGSASCSGAQQSGVGPASSYRPPHSAAQQGEHSMTSAQVDAMQPSASGPPQRPAVSSQIGYTSGSGSGTGSARHDQAGALDTVAAPASCHLQGQSRCMRVDLRPIDPRIQPQHGSHVLDPKKRRTH